MEKLLHLKAIQKKHTAFVGVQTHQFFTKIKSLLDDGWIEQEDYLALENDLAPIGTIINSCMSTLLSA